MVLIEKKTVLGDEMIILESQIKNLRLHNVSIHRNFYQNRFKNEYARKKNA